MRNMSKRVKFIGYSFIRHLSQFVSEESAHTCMPELMISDADFDWFGKGGLTVAKL